MNWNQIAGNWKMVKGKVKEKWGKLTDHDLTTLDGKREQLVGLLQQKYGYGQEQAQREIDAFANDLSLSNVKDEVNRAVDSVTGKLKG
jgi:uncharacterized protein YjbJ (UPF0337 family)